MEIGNYHVATHRAGSTGYTIGRPRGTVAVWHDSKLYLYRRPYKAAAREIKAAIRDAWESRHTSGPVRISGRFPEYTVDTAG